MLSGIGLPPFPGAAVAGEISRDDLVPYATSDQAEIVYPVALYESWNAIGCCGAAAAKNVNDLAFLEALVAKVDPGHARQHLRRRVQQRRAHWPTGSPATTRACSTATRW